MEYANDVFVEAAFQGRLFKCSEDYQAEFGLFVEMLEAYGMSLLNTPGYTVSVPPKADDQRIRVEVKLLGVWTPIWIKVREPGVLVLYDR